MPGLRCLHRLNPSRRVLCTNPCTNLVTGNLPIPTQLGRGWHRLPFPNPAGRTDEAIRLHEQTLADRERVLGPDHPETLSTRNNLAAYRDAGSTPEEIDVQPSDP